MINKYPYTDFNEYNLDWCITKIRDLMDEWKDTKQEWSDYKTELDNAINYINTYFENLDLQEEVNVKLNAMKADGSLSAIIEPYLQDSINNVPGIVTDWLEDNITQETGYVIDDSLTVEGAAADAKSVGDKLTEINNMLDSEVYISSYNKLDTTSAIGETASTLINHHYYFGMGKTLADYGNAYNVIVFCDTTTSSTSGLTAHWLYADETTNPSFITLNSSYAMSGIANKDTIVGIEFVVYSAGYGLVISKLGVKFDSTPGAGDEDTYTVSVRSARLDDMEDRINNVELCTFDDADALTLTEGNGVVSNAGAYNTSDPRFKHGTANVTPKKHYKISGRTFGVNYPVYVWFDSVHNVVGYGTADSTKNIIEVGIAPDNAATIEVNYTTDNNPYVIPGVVTPSQAYIDKRLAGIESYWNGKKIVWFGTSIPAGVIDDGMQDGEYAYPTRIGEMLGATVYNEAIGGSGVRSGDFNSITAEDPMGYGGVSAPCLMLSLSLSSSEKQDIIDDWNLKWRNIITWNQNLIDVSDPTYITMYKNASWDILLAKYLTGGYVGPVDLYVFDHGFNDNVRTTGFSELGEVPAVPDDRSYFLGAMAFLITKILEDNPNAQICFIGHWSDQTGSGNLSTRYLADAQEKLNDIWKFPIFKTWDNIGWSTNEITVNGVTQPVYRFWCVDGVHPASDTTGKALQHYAEVLYPFIRDVR